MKRRKQTVKDEEEMVTIISNKDKPDSELCPVCGKALIRARSGTWCVNPDCEVLDDADNYI
ncbi:MAG: hypothetical protein NTX36_02230 [Proteobacteria bacterium]|nr:hypothetical protein [Pseudomonadota bacterium]